MTCNTFFFSASTTENIIFVFHKDEQFPIHYLQNNLKLKKKKKIEERRKLYGVGFPEGVGLPIFISLKHGKSF